MKDRLPCIRSNYPNAFRSGEWAAVIGVSIAGDPARCCFKVLFCDGVQDDWPVEDVAAEYEFRPSVRNGGRP